MKPHLLEQVSTKETERTCACFRESVVGRMELNDLTLVTLNVSGQIFCTTKSTLLSQGDNYFSALVSERIPSKLRTEDGAYFIDRDIDCFSMSSRVEKSVFVLCGDGEPRIRGTHFIGVILNYLRTGQVLPNSNINPKLLKIEADFYSIRLPEEKKKEKVKTTHLCAILQYQENLGLLESKGKENLSLFGDIEPFLGQEFNQTESTYWKTWLVKLQHHGWELKTSDVWSNGDLKERTFIFTKEKKEDRKEVGKERKGVNLLNT